MRNFKCDAVHGLFCFDLMYVILLYGMMDDQEVQLLGDDHARIVLLAITIRECTCAA